MGAQFDTLQELQDQYLRAKGPLDFEPFPKDTGVQQAYDASLKQFSRQIDAASGPATRADRLMQSKSIPAKIGGGLLTALAALNPDFLRLREQKRNAQMERQTFLEGKMLELEMERSKNQYNLQLLEYQTRQAALEARLDNQRLIAGEIGEEEARRRDDKRADQFQKAQIDMDQLRRDDAAGDLTLQVLFGGRGGKRTGGLLGGGGGKDPGVLPIDKYLELVGGDYSKGMTADELVAHAERYQKDFGAGEQDISMATKFAILEALLPTTGASKDKIDRLLGLREIFEQRTATEPPPDEETLAKQRKEELERQRMQALVDSLKQGTPGGYQIPRETGTALDWIQSLGKFAPPGIVPNLIGNVLSSPGYQKFVEPVMAPYVTGHPSEGPTTMQRVLEFERRNQPPPEGLTRFLPPSSGGQSILRR